jgi:hypothetical protein
MAQLVAWQGSVTLLSLTTECNTTGFRVGDLLTAIYRARLAGGQPPSSLLLIARRAAFSLVRTTGGGDQFHGAGNYSGLMLTGRGTRVNFASTKNFTISPGVVNAGTLVVGMSGTINRFASVVDCTATFRGSFVRRPD